MGCWANLQPLKLEKEKRPKAAILLLGISGCDGERLRDESEEKHELELPEKMDQTKATEYLSGTPSDCARKGSD